LFVNGNNFIIQLWNMSFECASHKSDAICGRCHVSMYPYENWDFWGRGYILCGMEVSEPRKIRT
jgi:hypothetical protein